MRTLLILLLALPAVAASLPSSKPEDVGLSSDRLHRIHTMLDGYIQRNEIAGAVSLVARRGKIAWTHSQGVMNLDSKQAMKDDSIFRIASMTKPIASVALMMLFEEGKFQLNDPVSKWIPELAHPMVAVPEAPLGYKLVPADKPITIRHLLTHTAGLANTYTGFTVAEFNKLGAQRGPNETIGDFVKKVAKLPLEFQPGTGWAYGPATDVVGYLVEVMSGKPLDQFLAERIFKQLAMKDTFFYQPDENLPRMATIYAPADGGKGIRAVPMPAPVAKKYFSGAGGLSSTVTDYARFCQMMLNGGQLEGARLLSRKTTELMTTNHIGKLRLWSSLPAEGFGLGYSVRLDVGDSAQIGSVGAYGWGGAFGTYFWIDPKEQMFGILMIQLRPYNHVNIRQDFRTLATAAIVD